MSILKTVAKSVASVGLGVAVGVSLYTLYKVVTDDEDGALELKESIEEISATVQETIEEYFDK